MHGLVGFALLACLGLSIPRTGDASRAAGACTLAIAPSTATAEQGAVANFDFASQPNAAIDVLVTPPSPFAATALLFDQGPFRAATTLVGGGANDGFHYAFATGFDGHALLGIPIPRSAADGSLQVSATATCGPGMQQSAQASSTVGPAQLVPFAGHLLLSGHDIVIRTVELPPNSGAVSHDSVTIQAAPAAMVTLLAILSSSNAANLGSAVDGGTAHQPGDITFAAEGSADAGGQAVFSLPIGSDLLAPGRGAVLRLIATCATGAGGTVYRTSLPIRETPLRLLVQPAATTRGSARPLFVLGGAAAGSSTLHMLVLADKGAHLTGAAGFGSVPLTAQALAGAGGRGMLLFSVPNAAAPARGSHGTAAITVTSSFRGVTITRAVVITYGRR